MTAFTPQPVVEISDLDSSIASWKDYLSMLTQLAPEKSHSRRHYRQLRPPDRS